MRLEEAEAIALCIVCGTVTRRRRHDERNKANEIEELLTSQYTHIFVYSDAVRCRKRRLSASFRDFHVSF